MNMQNGLILSDEQFIEVKDLSKVLDDMDALAKECPPKLAGVLTAIVDSSDWLLLNNFPSDQKAIALRMHGRIFKTHLADRGVNRYRPEFNPLYQRNIARGLELVSEEAECWDGVGGVPVEQVLLTCLTFELENKILNELNNSGKRASAICH